MEVFVVAGLLILNTLVLRHLAFKIFKMFDMGAFLDYAWRMYCGQRPNIDFFTHVGPVFPGLIALFFKFFGPGMPALFWLLAVSHGTVITAVYLLMRKRVSAFVLWLCVLLTVTGYYWCLAFPWYTHTAHIWPLLAVVIMVRAMPFKSVRWLIACFVIAGAAVFVTLTTKPNLAIIYTAVFFAAAVVRSKHRFYAVTAYAAGILLALVISERTFLPDIKGFFDQTIAGFGLSQRWRVVRIMKEPDQLLINHYWIVALLVLSNVIIRKIRQTTLLLLFLGVGCAAIFETLTSGAVYQCNTPLMGLFMGLGFLIIYPPDAVTGTMATASISAQQRLTRVRKIGVLGLSLLSCILIPLYAKYGLEVKQWDLPDRYDYTTENQVTLPWKGVYPLRSKPFEGWLSAEDQGKALDEMTEAVNRFVPPDESPLILTDLLPLNMTTGRPGYIGAYVPYMIPSAPADGKARYEHHRLLISHPPRWIVTHDKLVAFISPIMGYLHLIDFIQANYTTVFRSGTYVLLKYSGSGQTA